VLVYHYTSVNGLIGIITSKKMWATDVWYMNDTREATYGQEVIKAHLDSKRHGSGNEQLVAESALQQIQHMPHGPDGSARSYIACFSKNPDQLSQWRGYGRNRGFSIGFATAGLRSISADLPHDCTAHLHDVIYELEAQTVMLEEEFGSTIATFPPPANVNDALPAARSFLAAARLVATTFKHAAFTEEAEVRQHLYQYQTDTASPLEFRDSQMGLTPSISLPLSSPKLSASEVIKEIVVGPQRNRDEAARATQQLLARHDLKDTPVRLSEVPLRP
jgi:Protein of unknown function (DUF2971)